MTSRAPPALAIIVPCYNEQDVLPETCERISGVIEDLVAGGKVSARSALYFVDDGSRDHTWELIESFARSRPRVAGIKLSRNRGHQNALLAGLFTADGDAILSIDADLQDDVTVIPGMVERYLAGADIVYAVRKSRDSDSWLKRTSARMFYRLMRSLGVDSIDDHADFRLMSRRAIDGLKDYREVNL